MKSRMPVARCCCDTPIVSPSELSVNLISFANIGDGSDDLWKGGFSAAATGGGPFYVNLKNTPINGGWKQGSYVTAQFDDITPFTFTVFRFRFHHFSGETGNHDVQWRGVYRNPAIDLFGDPYFDQSDDMTSFVEPWNVSGSPPYTVRQSPNLAAIANTVKETISDFFGDHTLCRFFVEPVNNPPHPTISEATLGFHLSAQGFGAPSPPPPLLSFGTWVELEYALV